MTASNLRSLFAAAADAAELAHDGPDPAHVAAGAHALRRLAEARHAARSTTDIIWECACRTKGDELVDVAAQAMAAYQRKHHAEADTLLVHADDLPTLGDHLDMRVAVGNVSRGMVMAGRRQEVRR